MKNCKLIIAVSAPILILLSLTFYKKYLIENGKIFTFAIEGRDPRDLLSGHYLTYRVLYNIENLCEVSNLNNYSGAINQTICLEPARSIVIPECKIELEGQCQGREFYANIEKFFIPEEHAKTLEDFTIAKRASIKVSVYAKKAYIKNLLIDGKDWQDSIK